MNHVIKSIVSKILKSVYGNSITSKKFQGTESRLYYEKAQHLIFAFRAEVAYEPVLQRKVSKYINTADTVFDIGGNIGQYTLLLSHLVGQLGNVITLEPDSKNFSFLQFNIAVNELTNVVCLKKGVGRSDGVTDFYRDSETGGRKGSFDKQYVDSSYKGHKERVETVTLDTLIDQYGMPAFVKIDVEGFEAEVMAGLTKDMLNTTFLVEVRDETKEAVFNHFQQRGFLCFHIDNEIDVPILNADSIPGFANLLFKKS